MIKLVLLVSVLFAEETKSFEDEAKALLAPFKKELMSTLQSTMKEQGVIKALDKCHEAAPQILKENREKLKSQGITFGRTSHKLRSQSNAAPDWIKDYLSQFTEGKLKDPVVVKADGLMRYLEPIYIQPACLNCHGEKIAPEVETNLNKLYPKDQARSFKVGEFRGLFWLEKKL